MTSYEPGPGPDVFPVGKHWDVHKFGGTCVATPGRMQDVVDLIVRERKENICGESMQNPVYSRRCCICGFVTNRSLTWTNS